VPLEYPFGALPAPGSVLEIQPGVLWVRMPLPMALDHINLYLLEDTAGWWIVDTGLRGNETRELWEQVFAGPLAGRRVCGIVCTHCHPDHIGQAGWLSERWRAPLYMTHGEYYNGRVFSTPAADGPLWEGEEFYRQAGAPQAFLDGFTRRNRGYSGLVEPMPRSFHRVNAGDRRRIGGSEWEAVVGRGHSPEHLCLLNRERQLLISGDQVIPIITSNVSVMAIEPEANPLADWLASHERFFALPDEVLVLPAHNTPFRGLHQRLRSLIAHHEEHLRTLERACIEPRTAMELLPVMFRRPLGNEQIGLALGECIAHLHLLRARGAVVRETGADGLHRYRTLDPEAARREQPEEGDETVMAFEGQPI
jgi:glyoxylase-like metal-dependent hydrolase (beta-lactamase superfamily II)